VQRVAKRFEKGFAESNAVRFANASGKRYLKWVSKQSAASFSGTGGVKAGTDVGGCHTTIWVFLYEQSIQ